MQQCMHVWLKIFKFSAKTVTTMAVGRSRLATVSTLHALQQKQWKKQKTSPHDKFKALDKQSRERRRLRKHMRVKRSSSAAQPASKIRNSKLALKRMVSRPGSKNSHNKASIALTTAKRTSRAFQTHDISRKQQTPQLNSHEPRQCCGRRSTRCTCFGTGIGQPIAQSFQQRLFRDLPSKIAASDIETWRDTRDMKQYAKQIVFRRGMTYQHLFATAFCWRQHSNHFFWQALIDCGAVSHNARPVWHKVKAVMHNFATNKESYLSGGLFYDGRSLKQYRFNPKHNWTNVETHSQDSAEQPDSRINARITGWKIARHVSDLMSDRFQELQSNPTRESWHACTHGFLQELQARSKGCYSHYAVKLMLDGVLTTQPQLHKVVSWWPMLCTAYKSELPLMYANIERNEDQLFLAAVHWHTQLKNHFKRMKFNESLAQLCWIKRGVTS